MPPTLRAITRWLNSLHGFADSMTRHYWIRIWYPLAVVTGFSFLVAAFLSVQLHHLGRVPDHHDALFSIWRLAWFAHQIVIAPARLFDANIFYPEAGTLAYSDATLFQSLLAAPLIWTSIPPVVAYNLLILLSFVAAGSCMFLLVRALTQNTIAAGSTTTSTSSYCGRTGCR